MTLGIYSEITIGIPSKITQAIYPGTPPEVYAVSTNGILSGVLVLFRTVISRLISSRIIQRIPPEVWTEILPRIFPVIRIGIFGFLRDSSKTQSKIFLGISLEIVFTTVVSVISCYWHNHFQYQVCTSTYHWHAAGDVFGLEHFELEGKGSGNKASCAKQFCFRWSLLSSLDYTYTYTINCEKAAFQ